MEQIRIIKEMREYDRRANGRADDLLRPRYMVWENVCGALSSNKGEDFRIVLEETARVADKDAVIPGLAKGQKWAYSGCIMGDGWSIAWRVHDARFWGVPQRRKRIALVADFGGSSAPEILFERKGLSGDAEQSRPQGEETSRQTEGGVGTANYTLKIRGGREVDSAGKRAGKGPLIQKELSGTLGVSQDQTLFQADAVCIGNGQANSQVSDIVGALNCMHDQQAVVYGISPYDSNAMKSSNPNSGIYEADTARTLDNNGGSPACNQGGMLVLDKHNMSVNEDKTQTLIQGEKNIE
jgi:DNA (cytosine-5)-methyltransferase 1